MQKDFGRKLKSFGNSPVSKLAWSNSQENDSQEKDNTEDLA